jgi:hypothetical protein
MNTTGSTTRIDYSKSNCLVRAQPFWLEGPFRTDATSVVPFSFGFFRVVVFLLFLRLHFICAVTALAFFFLDCIVLTIGIAYRYPSKIGGRHQMVNGCRFTGTSRGSGGTGDEDNTTTRSGDGWPALAGGGWQSQRTLKVTVDKVSGTLRLHD